MLSMVLMNPSSYLRLQHTFAAEHGQTLYLEHSLVDPNDVLQRSDRLLKSLADTVHVRHKLQVVVLEYLAGVSVLEERLYQALSPDCMRVNQDEMDWKGQVDVRISCLFTSGCFSQLPSNLDPWAVLHLFSSPNSVVFLFEPCTSASAVSMGARGVGREDTDYVPGCFG